MQTYSITNMTVAPSAQKFDYNIHQNHYFIIPRMYVKRASKIHKQRYANMIKI